MVFLFSGSLGQPGINWEGGVSLDFNRFNLPRPPGGKNSPVEHDVNLALSKHQFGEPVISPTKPWKFGPCLLACLCGVFASQRGSAESAQPSSAGISRPTGAPVVPVTEIPVAKDDHLRPFHSAYLSLVAARNAPASFSEERFDQGLTTPALFYRHFLDDRWMMTVGGGFKSLYYESRQSMLPILSITHEAGWVVRLYHPTYLVVGPKMLYMVPASKVGLPLQRDEELAAEFGVGVGLTLLHAVSRSWIVHAGIDRWRGTVTNIFHGIEVTAGAGIAIGDK